MQAKDIMSSPVVSVSPGHSIRHATKIMLQHDISGVPVIDGDGLVVGMLTEGDLMRRCEVGAELPVSPDTADPLGARAQNFIKGHAWNVQDVMTSPATCVTESDTVASIAALFLAKGIKRVPVLRDEQLIGVVSRRDLLQAIIDAPQAPHISGDDRILISVLAQLRSAVDLIGTIPQVSVRQGIIILEGPVQSQPVRDAIRVIADAVRGSAGVEDRMTCAEAPTRSD